MAFIRPGGGGGTFTGGTVPDATTFESDVTFETNPLLNSVIGTNGTSTYVSFLKAETQPSSGSYLPLYSAYSSAPGDTEAGFLSGSLFVVGDGTTANLFVNQGSATSADFNQIITDNAGTYSSNLQFTGTAVRLGSIVSGGGNLVGTDVTDMTIGDPDSGAHFYMEEGLIQIGDASFEGNGYYLEVDDSGSAMFFYGAGNLRISLANSDITIGGYGNDGTGIFLEGNEVLYIGDDGVNSETYLSVDPLSSEISATVNGTAAFTAFDGYLQIGRQVSHSGFPSSFVANMTAATTLPNTFQYYPVKAASAITLSSTPTISNTNAVAFSEITIFGTSDTNTVTLQDNDNLAGSNLFLSGGLDITLGLNDNVTFYRSENGQWVEKSRMLR